MRSRTRDTSGRRAIRARCAGCGSHRGCSRGHVSDRRRGCPRTRRRRLCAAAASSGRETDQPGASLGQNSSTVRACLRLPLLVIAVQAPCGAAPILGHRGRRSWHRVVGAVWSVVVAPAGSCDDESAGGGEGGDGADRGVGRDEVGDDAGGERADGEADVAPEAVDADDAGAIAWLGRVRDGGDQRRVDHRGADAEQDRGGERGGEGCRRRRRGARARRPGRACRRRSAVCGRRGRRASRCRAGRAPRRAG